MRRPEALSALDGPLTFDCNTPAARPGQSFAPIATSRSAPSAWGSIMSPSKLIVALLVAAGVAACANDPYSPKQDSGAVTGAIAGGALGALLGGRGTGSRVAGAVIGAAAGGLLGSAIRASLDEQEPQRAYAAAMHARESGAPRAPGGSPAVGVATTNLRLGPGTNVGVAATVPGGSVVDITGGAGQWCTAHWRGRTGYMIATNLDLGGQGGPVGGPPVVIYDDPPPYFGPPYSYYGPRYRYLGPRYRSWRRW